jgi:hypothetical protein
MKPMDVVSVAPYAVQTRTPASIHDSSSSEVHVSPPSRMLCILAYIRLPWSGVGLGKWFKSDGVDAMTVQDELRS